jgi:hypothetical protein
VASYNIFFEVPTSLITSTLTPSASFEMTKEVVGQTKPGIERKTFISIAVSPFSGD